VAIEFAMAHRQLVPAFVSAPAASTVAVDPVEAMPAVETGRREGGSR
jgi:hypothetical protein